MDFKNDFKDSFSFQLPKLNKPSHFRILIWKIILIKILTVIHFCDTKLKTLHIRLISALFITPNFPKAAFLRIYADPYNPTMHMCMCKKIYVCVYVCVCFIYIYKISYIYKILYICMNTHTHISFPDGSVIKNSCDNARDPGDTGLIPGSGRSPRGGNDNLFQYSCLENLMGGRARWALVH